MFENKTDRNLKEYSKVDDKISETFHHDLDIMSDNSWLNSQS